MVEADFFRGLTRLIKQGRLDDALVKLRSVLRANGLEPDEVERAGRLLAGVRKTRERDIKVHVLAQCSGSWLVRVLEAISFGHGVELSISEGQFDNVLQDLAGLSASAEYDILIFLPWNQRLLGRSSRDRAARIHDELTFWREVWQLARERSKARIIQVGYDWVLPGAHGYHLGGRAGGDVALIRELNEAIRQAQPQHAHFVDLEQISGMTGRLNFYDPRQYHWTKQPFSQLGLVALAEQLFAGIRASTTGAKKVLVVDLDNTLWGGVVGELGPQRVRLGDGADGEAFQAFQEHLKALSERGVLLAVASKNNLADAEEPFDKHPNMVLSLNDFAAFEASWQPKARMLQRVSDALGLGLDSFVFFDDNPAEREHIRQALPEVEVVDVPAEPAEYVRILQLGGWFETNALTVEDQMRTQQYAAEGRRNRAKASSGSVDDYLGGLEMLALVRTLDDDDLARAVQLLGKTNQFNLTTRRHSEDQVRELLSRPKSVCITVRMKDRFGDHGLVACILAVPIEGADVPSLRIDTWLMSCRVIGRTLEQLTMRELASRACALGYRCLVGEFVASAKNQQVASLYPSLGFEPTSVRDGVARFQLDLLISNPMKTFVAVEEPQVKP